MCTILLEPETLPAEKRSIRDSQKAVDELMELERRISTPFDPEEQRISMKKELFDIPRNIYVWLDNMNYCSEKKGFYYVRYQNSMLWNGTTAYARPVLVVQKSKLRPDQVEYMERKCEETRADAKRKRNPAVPRGKLLEFPD